MDNFQTFYGDAKYNKEYFTERTCVYTAEEIAQQPRLWGELGALMAEKKAEIATFLAKVGDLRQTRIIFTGAGSSAFVGDALAILLGKVAGIKAESIHTTDLVAAPDSYLFADIPTLLVSFARSGNSPESVGAVTYARAVVKDLYEVAIICDGTSSLSRCTAQSDKSLTLLMPVGSNDRGFAMTSSVSCMFLAGYTLFNTDKIDDITEDLALLSHNVLTAAPEYARTAINCAGKDFDRVAYLGSGFLKGTAHEASLKMMELTNGAVNGSYETATGFRHGPKSMIKDKTVTVHLISHDPFTARYDIDLLKEVDGQKKQNQVITIQGDDMELLPGDEVLTVAAGGYKVAGDICTGLEALVFCQMFALFTSLARGITTDDPSPSGEVNRVVKGVTVYDLP